MNKLIYVAFYMVVEKHRGRRAILSYFIANLLRYLLTRIIQIERSLRKLLQKNKRATLVHDSVYIDEMSSLIADTSQ